MAEIFRSSASKELCLPTSSRSLLVKWKVLANQKVSQGSILAVYKKLRSTITKDSGIVVLPKFKSDTGGLVKRLLVAEGEEVEPGQPVILLDICEHKTIMKDMCAECGADLRSEPGIPGNLKEPVSASVALVHNIPELRVSQEEAKVLGQKDKEVLLENKKLVLVVDLDQTLIHTTTENVPVDMKDVYHFQLYGQACWYHTKFRPGWKTFLEDMSKYYQLHIFTMGSRMYAHTIARMIDPTGELFADRIRSRDESFDMFSKYRDLSVLFPCDDSMVCIIDDREDIWDCAPNLVTVKPYRFFSGTGDINAPPGSDQTFTHPSVIPMHENAIVHADQGGTPTGPEGVNNDAPPNKEKQDEKGGEDSTSKMAVVKSVSENAANDGKSKERKESCTENSKMDFDLSESGFSDNVSEVIAMDTSDVTTSDSVCQSGGIKNENELENRSENCSEIQVSKKVDASDMITEATSGQGVDVSKELMDEGLATQENVEKRNETASIEKGGGTDEKAEGGVTSEGQKGIAYSCSKGGEIKETERHDGDCDDYLLYLEEILRRIHQRFYEILARCRKVGECSQQEPPPDLRFIMPELRQAVLKGTNMVFTGVIPTNCKHEESQIWRAALQFGANVSKDLLTRKNTADRSKRTTHVVAARPGTEKACQASRLPSVKLVNPNWLWTCAERWEFVDERLFPVEDYERYKSRRHDTPPVSRPTTEDLESVASSNPNKWGIVEGRGQSYGGESSYSEPFKVGMTPFLSFSSGEMEAMDKEVEDLMRSSEGEEDEGGNYGDQEVFGSVSSSSSSTENDEGSNGWLRSERDRGGKMLGVPQGKTVNFSTITQTLYHDKAPETMSKIRKLDFCDDGDEAAAKRLKSDEDEGSGEEEEGTEGEFSSVDRSSNDSGSSDDDGDDGNDMAAMLEAAIYS